MLASRASPLLRRMLPGAGRSLASRATQPEMPSADPAPAWGPNSLYCQAAKHTEDAQNLLNSWQRQWWLSVNNVWDEGREDCHVDRAYLPFWAFDATVDTRFTGTLGFRQGRELVWQDIDEWFTRESSVHPFTHPDMQVYASYRYNRDMGRAARGDGSLFPQARPASQGWLAPPGDAECGRWRVDPAAMPAAVAWQLALRGINRREVEHARGVLRAKYNADEVRGVRVEVEVLGVTPKLAYLPAYIISYAYGEKHNVAGEIVPERFIAGVGAVDGTVVAQRHFSPRKAQFATATTLGAAAFAAEMAMSPVLGYPMLSVESALGVGIVSAVAGVAARSAHKVAAEQEEARRLQEEEEEAAGWGVCTSVGGRGGWSDREVQRQRDDREWARWESSDKAAWREDHRRQWAEGIWRGQEGRRLDRERWAAEQDMLRAQLRDHAEREQRRLDRFGPTERMDAHGRTAGRMAPGRALGGRARDFLGFYRILGVDTTATSEDIKAAFRKLAMQHHPDRANAGGEAGEGGRAVDPEVFTKVQTAYDVLRDDESRRRYDRGMLSSSK